MGVWEGLEGVDVCQRVGHTSGAIVQNTQIRLRGGGRTLQLRDGGGLSGPYLPHLLGQDGCALGGPESSVVWRWGVHRRRSLQDSSSFGSLVYVVVFPGDLGGGGLESVQLDLDAAEEVGDRVLVGGQPDAAQLPSVANNAVDGVSDGLLVVGAGARPSPAGGRWGVEARSEDQN